MTAPAAEQNRQYRSLDRVHEELGEEGTQRVEQNQARDRFSRLDVMRRGYAVALSRIATVKQTRGFWA